MVTDHVKKQEVIIEHINTELMIANPIIVGKSLLGSCNSYGTQ